MRLRGRVNDYDEDFECLDEIIRRRFPVEKKGGEKGRRGKSEEKGTNASNIGHGDSCYFKAPVLLLFGVCVAVYCSFSRKVATRQSIWRT